MMFAAAALALLATIALALARAALGPTLFDRAQAANTVGTVAMLLLAVPVRNPRRRLLRQHSPQRVASFRLTRAPIHW